MAYSRSPLSAAKLPRHPKPFGVGLPEGVALRVAAFQQG